MIFQQTGLADAVLIAPERREDDRGWFARTFCEDEFARNGLDVRFIQHNASRSARRGTLRGMHFQRGSAAEAKVVRCVRGSICDVVIDLRPESRTSGRWQAFELSEDNGLMLYVPRGFAHGFLTLSDQVETHYLVSAPHAPGAEGGVRWNDPAFSIAWPFEPLVISDKDRSWPDFAG
jgi:dTDP-4-dehydrorhamnose 3,5-epimerase